MIRENSSLQIGSSTLCAIHQQVTRIDPLVLLSQYEVALVEAISLIKLVKDKIEEAGIVILKDEDSISILI
jgi:hypothetical protein